MSETTVETRDLIRRELARYRPMLLYAERRKLDRGEFVEVARTIRRRMRLAWIGMAVGTIGILLWVLLGSAPVLRPVTAILWTSFWFAFVSTTAHGWGRVAGVLQVIEPLMESSPAEEAPGEVPAE